MAENKIVKEMREWIGEELKKCNCKADVAQCLLKAYTSMYALAPKEGRDILNEVEDAMKTDAVNYSLEHGYIPN